jgi:pimeloyl-ACP methyl ester carboxylesterase
MSVPPTLPPQPPVALPPARTVVVDERGEFFLRDTGGDGPIVMLLHGWLVSADLNWCGAYGDLAAAGYRVLAPDHRGHGRGLRPLVPFRLADCAADCAGILRTLKLAPALIVGYSMGGAIAQLIARDHRDVVSGIVLSGTAQDFQERRDRRAWRTMGALGMALSIAPQQLVGVGFRTVPMNGAPGSEWLRSEMLRHSPRDIAEAGRELGRFDSRPWLHGVDVPAAVVLTSRDEAVPPVKQRRLADSLRARVFEVPIGHLEVTTGWQTYNPVLLEALASIGGDQVSAAA